MMLLGDDLLECRATLLVLAGTSRMAGRMTGDYQPSPCSQTSWRSTRMQVHISVHGVFTTSKNVFRLPDAAQASGTFAWRYMGKRAFTRADTCLAYLPAHADRRTDGGTENAA